MELWKDIEGFENYQVSSWGRVRSANGILKPYRNKKGYLKVGLMKGGKCHKKRVNRLVAMAFIDNPNEFPFVDHIDGNKENNSVENLEWIDNSGNQTHSRYVLQNATGFADTPVRCVELNKIFISTRAAWRETGISYCHISECANGKRKTAGSFHWEKV